MEQELHKWTMIDKNVCDVELLTLNLTECSIKLCVTSTIPVGTITSIVALMPNIVAPTMVALLKVKINRLNEIHKIMRAT